MVPLAWSTTWVPSTLTKIVSLLGSVDGGDRVKVMGPPDTLAVIGPVAALVIVNHGPVKLTDSLKVIVIGLVTETLVAPLAGEVATTTGGTGGGKIALTVSRRSS